MHIALLSIMCFCYSMSCGSIRLSQEYINKQDSYESFADIQICALQKVTLESIQIDSATLRSIVDDALMYAIQKSKYLDQDDGTMIYSIQTVFAYINKQLEQYKLKPDISICGSYTTILQLPCLHYFHEPCIRGWSKDAIQSTCPLCRSEFNNGQEKIIQITSITDTCPICLDFYVQPCTQRALPSQPSQISRLKRPKGINYKQRQRPPWR